MPTEKKSFRMDFEQEIIDFDKKTGRMRAILTPNPERYEKRTLNGELCYYDKFDNVYIPLEEIGKATKKIKSMPIYYSPSKIKSADEYILGRIDSIKSFIEKQTEEFEFRDLSEEFLESLKKDKMQFVILSIDLKGSTKMSQKISAEDNANIISLFSQEMCLIVEKFNGYILKNVGDGLIAYFPEPNFIGMHDNAIDCALTMKKMILYGINPILKNKELPELDFRIGLDSGEAIVKTLGAKNIKLHKDLIGETINIAAKIQSLAQNKQILLGESTALHLHTFWRQKIKKIENTENWDYKYKGTEEIYPIYYLLEKW